MTWKKLKPIKEPQFKGCLICGTVNPRLRMSTQLEVGFGDVCIYKDGMQVFSSYDHRNEKTGWCEETANVAEDMACKDEDHDWRIKFDAPLYSAVYQRQGKNNWLLVEKGDGFA